MSHLFNFYWSVVALQCCAGFFLYNKMDQLYVSIYAYILYFFGFPSHLDQHRALSRVLCGIQLILISYLFSV